MFFLPTIAIVPSSGLGFLGVKRHHPFSSLSFSRGMMMCQVDIPAQRATCLSVLVETTPTVLCSYSCCDNSRRESDWGIKGIFLLHEFHPFSCTYSELFLVCNYCCCPSKCLLVCCKPPAFAKHATSSLLLPADPSPHTYTHTFWLQLCSAHSPTELHKERK